MLMRHESISSVTGNITPQVNLTSILGGTSTAFSSLITTEGQVGVVIRGSGNLNNLYANCTVNGTGTADPSTYRLRIDSGGGWGDGNSNFSINSGTTGFFHDVTNSDALSLGSRIAIKATVPSETNSKTISFRPMGCLYRTDVNETIFQANLTTFGTASAQRFRAFNGSTSYQTTSAVTENKLSIAGTYHNMMSIVATNARANNEVVRFWLNGGAGNQTFTITASTTGVFEDVTNSDVVAIDDLITGEVTSGAGTSQRNEQWAIWFTSNSIPTIITSQAAYQLGLGTTSVGINAFCSLSVANDYFTGQTNLMAASFDKLGTYISAFAGAGGNQRVRLLKDGSLTDITVSPTGTGWWHDLTNVVNCTYSSEMQSEVIGSGSDTMTARNVNYRYQALERYKYLPLLGVG